jgi:acyl-CoA oxidase
MVYFVTTESLEVFTLRMEVCTFPHNVRAQLIVQLIGMADPSFATRFGVAYGLFLGALRSGATPNQFSEPFNSLLNATLTE